jgi:FlaA1/EpsC-like NDP-sugar epimerase
MEYTLEWIQKYLSPFLQRLSKFSYLSGRIIFLIDMAIVLVVFAITYYIRFNFSMKPMESALFLEKSVLCVAITGTFFLLFDTYTGFIRFSTFRDALRIFAALFCSNLFMLILSKSMPDIFQHSIYTKVGFLVNFLLAFCIIFFFRMVVRLLFDIAIETSTTKRKKPILIYGIEPTHIGLAKMIRSNEYLPYKIAGFITPEPIAHHRLMNYPIYSMKNILKNTALLKRIDAILISSDDLERSEKKVLAEKFLRYKIELLLAPPIEMWDSSIRKIKKINIEDLLGRVPIRINIESIGENLKGKTVLITGAAGSIGSEIVHQISRFDLGLLLLCDVAESPLHQLCLDLEDSTAKVKFLPLIADVRNQAKMESIFQNYKPHYIYHVAAYKHVPLMERYPGEAVSTNVFGTKNVSELALAYGAECFVMISTDKAVNPSNVMGASKRIAEIYIQSLSNQIKKKAGDSPHTRFITTRFGNVLGSNGSVIPRFVEQIKEGGPITVTHPDIIRYFMTIPEACSLVLEASNLGKGGEIFVFDMGESVKIKDMAEEMIRLSGLKPYIDIDIVYTGLRPGEKLHEELLYDKELVKPTHNEKIKIGTVCEYDFEWVVELLSQLEESLHTYNETEIVKVMKKIIPEFVSNNSIYEALDKKGDE